MIVKWFKQLSRFPRLRILLFIVVVIVVIVVLANLLAPSSPSVAPGEGISASRIDQNSGQGEQKPVNPVLQQRYQKLAQANEKEAYKQKLAQGQTILSSSDNGSDQQKTSSVEESSSAASTEKPSEPQSATSSDKTDSAAKSTSQPQALTPADYEKILQEGFTEAKAQKAQGAHQAQVTQGQYQRLEEEASQLSAQMNNTPSQAGYAVSDDQQGALADVERKASGVAHNVEANAAEVGELESKMRGQLDQLSDSWGLPKLQTVVGELPKDTKDDSKSKPGHVIIKAGDILYGVIDTQVDSDQPNAPVLATIAIGPYANAKLIGKYTLEGDRLVVQFTQMSIPSLNHTIGVSAYAIDAKTAQNALASHVDHHYLLRYGSLFAASFLQGFGNAFNDQGNNNNGCGPDSIICINTAQHVKATTRTAMYQGLGQIGTNLADSVRQNFDKPPTVTLDQGTGVGLLFMNDVSIK